MPEFKDKVEFEGAECVRESDKAICVRGVEINDIWIPKTQVDDDSEVWGYKPEARGPGRLIISEWIAKEKGLI
jgi:hypothetical protein